MQEVRGSTPLTSTVERDTQVSVFLFYFPPRLRWPERPAGSGKVRGSTPLTSTVERDTQVSVFLFYFPPRLRWPERPAGSGKVVKVDGCLLIVVREEDWNTDNVDDLVDS